MGWDGGVDLGGVGWDGMVWMGDYECVYGY